MAFQVNVVCLVLPVFKVPEEFQELLAKMDLRVFLDLLVALEIQALLVFRECLGNEGLLALQVPRETEVLQVKKDLKVIQAMMVLEVCLALQVHPAALVPQEIRVNLALLDFLDLWVLVDLRVLAVRLVPLVPLDSLDLQAMMDNLELKVKLVSLVRRVMLALRGHRD